MRDPHLVSAEGAAARTALLDRIDVVLAQLRLAKADADALGGAGPRAVRVGIDVLVGTRVAAIVLDALMRDSGGRWHTVERGPGIQLLQRVASGDLHAAFVPLPVASGPFVAMELLREPSVLVAPAAAAAGGSDVEAMLERWPAVRMADCRATTALLERYGVCPGPARPLHVAGGPVSALRLVRAGVAVAVMPVTEVPDDDTTVTAVALPDLPERVTGMAWHRDRDGCVETEGLRIAMHHAVRELASDGGASPSASVGAD